MKYANMCTACPAPLALLHLSKLITPVSDHSLYYPYAIFSFSCYFLFLRTTQSPQKAVLRHPLHTFFVSLTKCHTHIKLRVNYSFMYFHGCYSSTCITEEVTFFSRKKISLTSYLLQLYFIFTTPINIRNRRV